ncbi:hypothetical protein [Geminicoccus harenae]|uniref:hypothetical protein n=1 Tax=Geminicoccus harenae TaxID=2498453 RepID=UPI001C94C0BC|nr:hypothetical protein [Geminicoccus harenae]
MGSLMLQFLEMAFGIRQVVATKHPDSLLRIIYPETIGIPGISRNGYDLLPVIDHVNQKKQLARITQPLAWLLLRNSGLRQLIGRDAPHPATLAVVQGADVKNIQLCLKMLLLKLT